MPYQHIPVLQKESIELLNAAKGQVFIDCTLGGGGHSENIKKENPQAKIYAIDLDPDAIKAAKEKLVNFKDIIYLNDNYKNINRIVKEKADGIIFDLGISSYQIDEAGRGFSLQKEGPLDMRMDPAQKLSAREIINNYDQEQLERIFQEYSEERFSRRIARAIVKNRETAAIETTQQLKAIIEKAIPTWKKRESVTRIFQALRIAVNQELESLKAALPAAIERLNPGGRIVIISYHSLEDRIVKQALKKAGDEGRIRILTKKPIYPQADEMAYNPRARSAKLRAGEKL
jgi:16S rRNA (cytosine1402-N4)-methyltransferase